MVIIKIIVFAVVMYLISKVSEWRFENRTPPDGYKTDWETMSNDLATGKSKAEVMRKSNMGGYDISEKKHTN